MKNLNLIKVPKDGECLVNSLFVAFYKSFQGNHKEFIKKMEETFPEIGQNIIYYLPFLVNFENYPQKQISRIFQPLTLLLRIKIANYIEQYTELDEFYVDSNHEKLKSMTKKEYVEFIKTPGIWLGEGEIEAFCNIFKCEVEVQRIYQKNNSTGIDVSYYPLQKAGIKDKKIILQHKKSHYNFFPLYPQEEKYNSFLKELASKKDTFTLLSLAEENKIIEQQEANLDELLKIVDNADQDFKRREILKRIEENDLSLAKSFQRQELELVSAEIWSSTQYGSQEPEPCEELTETYNPFACVAA